MVVGMESWFSNFSQISQSWNSAETLADIPRPHLEYSVWGLFKGAEAASVVGGCIAHPLYRLYLSKKLTPETTTPNSHKVIRAKCRALQGRFLFAGIALGPALAFLHSVSGMTKSELNARCYAIRCDGEGLTIDRCAVVAGFVGWYWKRFQGMVDGINVGLAYALFNNKVLSKYTSPVLKDKVEPEERYETVEQAAANRSKLIKFISELDQNKENTGAQAS